MHNILLTSTQDEQEYIYDSMFLKSLQWTFIVVPLVTECFRLYFGYSGNLLERVPHMSSFLLLTCFPQLPFVFFLTVVTEHRYPFEIAAGSILLVILIVEAVLGYYANKRLTTKQTASFMRMCQEDEVPDVLQLKHSAHKQKVV